ncbi:MAG: DsbA family oxidoreductase [Acidimicrobiia bacterium]
MTPDFVLYSDFNCPFCYALGERVMALGVVDRIDWRGVQHAPHLPTPMAHAGPTFASELSREVQFVQRLAPEVPIALPRGKPNTARAIVAVAAAMDRDPAKAHRFAASLYRVFWQHGADISDPSVIRDLAHHADLPDLLMTPQAVQRITAWHEAWMDRGVGSVPDFIRQDGESITGLVDLDTLRRFVQVTTAPS